MLAIKSIFESIESGGAGGSMPGGQGNSNAQQHISMVQGGVSMSAGTYPIVSSTSMRGQYGQQLPHNAGTEGGFNIKNQIELKAGRAQRLRQINNQSNAVKYYRYKGLQGIWFLLLDTLANWDNVFLLIFIGIHFAAENEIELSPYTPIIILILNITVQGILLLVADLKLKSECSKLNLRLVEKFVISKKESNGFDPMPWESLRMGDIIKVKENEEFPADVLILDSINSSNDHKCYVRGGITDDFNVPSIKKACEGTYNRPGMKMSSRKFVEQISGKVKYEYNFSGYFSGSFKLNNNPAAFHLTMENVVARGSQLCHTKSVICLVLNVESQSIGSPANQLPPGRYTKSLLFPRRGSLLSFFETQLPLYDRRYYRPMRILQFILMVVFFIMSFIVFFQLKLSPSIAQHKFIQIVLQMFISEQQLIIELPLYIRQIFAFAGSLILSLPLNFKLIADLVVIMHANFCEWDYNLIPGDVRIVHNHALKALGSISDVVMSKHAIISLGIKKAKVFQVRDHWYFDQGGKKKEQIFSQSVGEDTQNYAKGESRKSKNMQGMKTNEQQNFQNFSSSVFGNYQYPLRMTKKNSQQNVQPQNVSDQHLEQSDRVHPEFYEGEICDNYSEGGHINAGNNNEDDMLLLGDNNEDYLPNSVQVDLRFQNTRLRKDIEGSAQSGNKQQLQEILHAVVVCHEARRVISAQTKYKSVNQEEEAFLMLAYSFGYQFLNKHNKSITLSLGRNGQRVKHHLMITQSFIYLGQHITVTVVRPFKTQSYQSGGVLYARGPMSAIFNFLDESEGGIRHTLLEDMKRYADLGVFPTVYVKRDLTGDEAVDLEGRINEALSLMKDQDDKIESSLLSYMNDMKILGVIGTQPVYNLRDTLVLEDLMKNGVRVWVLSEDDEIQTTVNMNALRLLNAESNPLIINGDAERDIEEQVSNCLNNFVDKGNPQKKDVLKKSFSQDLNNMEESKMFNSSSPPSSERKKEYKTLMIAGQSLNYILKEESLLKCLLTITSFCDMIIGSNVTPDQKCELIKSMKAFNLDEVNQNIMAIVSQSKDQILMSQADVSVALTSENQPLSSIKLLADISMNSLYPLTYLLFKHGTLCNRRVREVTKVLLYRTFLLAWIISTFMCIHAFSASLPFKRLMIILFIVLVSPLQIFFHGFSYRDVGFQYIYRVYGEYKRNMMVNLFNRYDLVEAFSTAGLDTVVYFLISFNLDQVVIPSNGRQFSSDGFQLYQGIILYFFFTFQLTNRNEVGHFIRFAVTFVNLIGIIFILDDEYLQGMKQFSGCPLAMLNLLFVFLFCLLRNFIMDLLRKLVYGPSKRRFEFYTDIEDRLFLEEYEDPDQVFDLETFEQDYKHIEKKLASRKIYVINQNLTKLPRCDELDEIIEKLNEYHSGNSIKKYQDEAILSLISLKFNDQNKEEEYIQSRRLDIVIQFRKIILVTLFFLALELIKDIILSSLGLIIFQSFWFFFGFTCLASLTLLFAYKFQNKVQLINIAFLVFLCVFYSFCYYYIDNIEFSMFFSIVIYTYSLRGIYVRFVILLVACVLAMNVSLVNSNFDSQIAKNLLDITTESHPYLVLPWMATLWTAYVICWSLFLFWEEKERRLEFWQGYKKIKEFQKLKSILHILMPAFVRERIRQGQRFIADDQGEVSVLFCDIGDFDNIVQMFSGKELCEWLDNIYLSFDQLCEKHGLQKVETVGKTYMACGGLKQSEKKMDQRLLNKHHSVRVADFAINILNFIKRQTLKDGQRVKVKIGIHSGKVISGVVGENKPQFSLIGDTINKTSRVCSKCYDNQVLISKETKGLLQTHTSFFDYTPQLIEMKGIGKEYAYYLRKGSSPQVVTYNEAAQKMKRENNREPARGEQSSQRRNASLQRTALHEEFTNIQALTSSNSRTGGNDLIEQRGLSIRDRKKFNRQQQQHSQSPERIHENDIQTQPGNHLPETSRSLIYSDSYSGGADPQEMANQSGYDENENKMDESFSQDHNFLNFGDFKGDRAIFKNAVENSSYNLIERPQYLLSFNQGQFHLEENYRYQKLKEDQLQKFTFFLLLFILNKFGIAFFFIETFSLDFAPTSATIIILYAFLPLLLLLELLIFFRLKCLTLASTRLTSSLVTLYFTLLALATTLQGWQTPHNTRLIQIYVNETMLVMSFVYFCSMLQMRQALIVYSVVLIGWIVIIATNHNLSFKTFSFGIELLYFIAMVVLKSHQKEMAQRKIHNRKIIMDFEIKRTNDLLSNLVPPPVLQGIKNDQKVVDELEDATLLFTDMVGFTQFSNNVKDPREVVKLLSELFTRFDQLCVKNKVYKVHTIGDCYVIMGYAGHIPQNQRTPQIKAEEAFRVTQTAFEMIDIISDVRNQSDNPDLKDLNMRIGIHTGKVVAGIIGTKIVRYDIFGSDVLIANKMESNGVAGKVVVSEETKNMLTTNEDFTQRLNFSHLTTVELQGIRRTVEAFIVFPREEGSSFLQDQSMISPEHEDDDDEYYEEESSQVDGKGSANPDQNKEELKVEDDY